MSLEVVNGYLCRNCADVSLAKKSIDPSRPNDGPNGANAPDARKVGAQDGPPGAAQRPSPIASAGQVFRPTVVNPAQAARDPGYTPGSTFDVRA